MGQSPQIDIKRGDLLDEQADEEDQIYSVSKNLNNINRLSVKPLFSKNPSKASSLRGVNSQEKLSPTVLDPGRRLSQLSIQFNSERFLGIHWGHQTLERKISLETELMNTFKRLNELLAEFQSPVKLRAMQDLKSSIGRQCEQLERGSRGAYFYFEILSIIEQMINQEKSPGYSRSLQYQDFDLIERSLKEKLEHKYDYLDKVTRNIEVERSKSEREGKTIESEQDEPSDEHRRPSRQG
jgi:hypothetical protein